MAQYSNYPNGFPAGVTVRGVPLMQAHPGKVFWVSNATILLEGQRGGSDGNKGTFASPFGTLDYAVGQCTAGRGDVIFVKPGHAETISTATALALDVAGIAIVGLGTGTLRPTFTLDTATTATIGVTAANVTVKNCIFTANFADIVAVFTSVAAKYLTLEDNLFKATATNMNFINVLDTGTVSNDMDGLWVAGNKWLEPDLATVTMIKMDGTNDNVTISDNYLNLGVNNNNAALMVIANGKLVTSLNCRKNVVYRLNTDTATGAILIHTNGSTNTGVVTENFAQHADTAAELLITATAGWGEFNNYASGVAGASGYILPAVDS
jgi:hypothetical protein